MCATHAFQEAPLPLFDAEEAQAGVLPEGRLPSYIKDHRQRLRDRFMQGGAAAMPDYELLELVLFRAIPRQDVKPLARRLLEVFGDFSAVDFLKRGQDLCNKIEDFPRPACPHQGDEPPGAVVLGCAAGLLSRGDGPPWDRAVSHPLP